ncbi:unnamed protein product [Linum tenue]|uniref:Oligopeptide transporter 4 n=1 Tax=Linum tenue TaxID=586396 RepID=A0AAV0I1T9_9ROSI|nr:unnamed protein product [Linum tenue]
MASTEIQSDREKARLAADEEESSPIEQVRLTVSPTDDPSLPVWTFRMWFLGLLSCALLSFLNQFFAYRTEALVITQITVQVATLPIGRFMAAVLPTKQFRVGSKAFSLNPGPFNTKEHVLISIFANAGSAFGGGSAYAVGIVNIIRAFYHRKISFLASWLLIITTQQIGSGMHGLGLGAFSLDWSTIAAFYGSPLTSPFFAIVNSLAGYLLIIYVAVPVAYWGFNLFGANKFPIFSSHLYTSRGEIYDITAIVNDKFELDPAKYAEQGRVHLSMFFALSYGFGFAAIAATLTHTVMFYGKEMYARFRASYNEKEDVHTRLMKQNYDDIPGWWFHSLLAVSIAVSLVLCTVLQDQVQMPWWGLIFASALAFVFTLPVSIITATTNVVSIYIFFLLALFLINFITSTVLPEKIDTISVLNLICTISI